MKISEKQNFTVVFNGDSITHGGRQLSMDCNHILGHGFPEMAAAELALRFAEKTPRFVNKGVSGRGIAHMAETWEQDVTDLSPALVNILIGINDAGKPGFSLSAWEEIYRDLLTRTRKACPACHLSLMSPFFFPYPPTDAPYENVPHPLCEPDFPWPARSWTDEDRKTRVKDVAGMCEVVARLAKDFRAVYIPAGEILQAQMRRAPASYFVWDGVHPTVTGHRVLANAFLDYTKECFE